MQANQPLLEERRTLINEAKGTSFFQHPVRWDISGEELTYLNKLFKNTVPTPPGHLWAGGCYLWCGSHDRDGYARHSPPAGMTGSRLVHRFVYQHAIGPEPDDPMWHFTGAGDDLTIHHECGNRACINLLHLQILPLKFNRELGNPADLYKR
jgi:hypothetical protein